MLLTTQTLLCDTVLFLGVELRSLTPCFVHRAQSELERGRYLAVVTSVARLRFDGRSTT